MKTLIKKYSGEIKPEERKQFNSEIGNAAFCKKPIQSERYVEMRKLNTNDCQPQKKVCEAE